MKPDDARLAYLATEVGALAWDITADELVIDELGERLFGLRRGSFGLPRGERSEREGKRSPGDPASFSALLDHIRDDSRDVVVTAMERAMTSGALEVEVAVDVSDGTARVLQLRGTVLHDGDGHAVRVVAGVRDVTTFTVQRTELAAARLELARRTDELRRANLAIEETAQTNASLLSRTSHEIRTRLQAILGMSRVLRDANMPPEQHEIASMIEVSAHGLLGNINDLVDLSGLDSELDTTPITVASLIASATAAFVSDGAALTVEADGGPLIRVDVARACRVLHHVVGSALGFSTGGVVVTGKAAPLGGTLHRLTVEVRGVGSTLVSDHVLFDGADASTIGLTISRKLVELMGGQIAAASKDRDTVISVMIPVDEAVAEDAPDEPIDPELGKQHPLRILVAEDNVFSRKVADAFLQKLGYHAKFACDGREALAMVTSEPFDVVFMDVHMPVMDGLEATRTLRADPPPGVVPRVIALTANAMPRDRAACLAAGCDEYLTKPVSIEKLARVLRACQRAPDVVVDPAAFDLGVLGDLESTLGAEVVAELIATYDADARELISGLRAAAARGDATGLVRAAHNLKSTSAALGARALGATCAELEASGRAGDLGGIGELVARADREFAHVRAALNARRS